VGVVWDVLIIAWLISLAWFVVTLIKWSRALREYDAVMKDYQASIPCSFCGHAGHFRARCPNTKGTITI
jgi:hypothetical protein